MRGHTRMPRFPPAAAAAEGIEVGPRRLPTAPSNQKTKNPDIAARRDRTCEVKGWAGTGECTTITTVETEVVSA